MFEGGEKDFRPKHGEERHATASRFGGSDRTD
jgi:hypothetical protein